MLWLLVGVGLVLCGVFPQLLGFAADVLGVRDTNVALFAVLIGGLVLVVLHLPSSSPAKRADHASGPGAGDPHSELEVSRAYAPPALDQAVARERTPAGTLGD